MPSLLYFTDVHILVQQSDVSGHFKLKYTEWYPILMPTALQEVSPYIVIHASPCWVQPCPAFQQHVSVDNIHATAEE